MRLAGSGEAHRRSGMAGGFGLPPFFINTMILAMAVPLALGQRLRSKRVSAQL
jgi:hypothetical protein